MTGPLLRSVMTLVVAPSGSGKTSVSARIVIHLRQQKEKVLVICDSNQGLDVIAHRIIYGFSKSTPPISTEGIYRLDTEFGEDYDIPASASAFLLLDPIGRFLHHLMLTQAAGYHEKMQQH